MLKRSVTAIVLFICLTTIGAAKRSMKVEDVEPEWAQGRNMTFDEAITLALAD